jgi:hypothetical protein
VARWAGWGAGPSGAGAAGPSRVFQGLALLGCLVVAAALAHDRRWLQALAAAAAAVYFALRLFGRLGQRRQS